MFKSTKNEYGTVAVIFHWASALLILIMIPLGFLMQEASEAGRLKWYQLHAVIGCVILLLTIARMVWKLMDIKPLPTPGLGEVHQKGMKFIHALLYLILMILTISGIVLIIQSGLVDVLRGATQDFPILEKNGARGAHGTLARVYMGLLIAHIGGVILHEVRHGHVLARMGIGRKNSGS